MNDLWFQIPLALVMGFFFVRLMPTAIYWVKNSPKGTTKEWLNAALLLGAVVLFVIFLMSMVRG